jgi:ribosomal subunit interface protein
MQVSEEQQGYARGKGTALMDGFPRVEHVHWILDHEKHRFAAEVVVQAKNHVRAEASEEASDLIAAIDMAHDKVEKQLRRQRDKVVDHKATMRYHAKQQAAAEPVRDDVEDLA